MDKQLKIGDRIHVEYWVGQPRWLTKNDGRVIELTDKLITMRDDRKTMGVTAKTLVTRSAVETITWK